MSNSEEFATVQLNSDIFGYAIGCVRHTLQLDDDDMLITLLNGAVWMAIDTHGHPDKEKFLRWVEAQYDNAVVAHADFHKRHGQNTSQ